MITLLARLVAMLTVSSLLLPVSVLAQSIISSQSLVSHLAIRCFDVDPNLPNAEGLLVLAPTENRLMILLDFNEFNNPVGPPPPGGEPFPIVNGVFDLSCEDFTSGLFNVNAVFSGPLGTYGWDFEANFTNFFPSHGPGLRSCINPRVDNFSFQRDAFIYNCVAGLLLPATNGN
jgi:hypothetical protein